MTPVPSAKPTLAVILAGGRSRRMSGRDKAVVRLGGQRLIDRVIERLRPQTDSLILSGPRDYGTGLDVVPDAPDAPEGPAGGIYSVHKRLLSIECGVPGFVTTPVDCPFVPLDLVQRLVEGGGAAIASDGENVHPTLAYWPLDTLSAAWPRLKGELSIPLNALAEICEARCVIWRTTDVFLNVNGPEDLAMAERVHSTINTL